MKIKTFEQWWNELETDVLNSERKYVWSEPLPATVQSTGSTHFSMHKATAKRWYSQIVESAEPKPEQPRCKIMRRLGPMDDTPLGCYVPVAWCEDYGMFEELLKGAKIEHGLICVQEQAEEASEPAKEPEPDEGPFVLLLIFKDEAPYYRGEFDTREEAQDWAKQEAAFAAPGSRQYKIVTAKEWEAFKAKTATPSIETPPAPDPS